MKDGSDISTMMSLHGFDNEENDISLIVNTLLARKLLIFSCFLVGIFFATLYILRSTPQYVSLSEIMVSSAPQITAGNVMQSIGGSVGVDVADLRSRVEILQSRQTIRQLVKKARLYQLPEVAGSKNFSSFEDVSEHRLNIIISQVLKRLSVKPVLGTSLIDVSYRSRDPNVAAETVNYLVFLYVNDELKRKKSHAKQASDWLAERLEKLREDVENAEIALEKEHERFPAADIDGHDPRLLQIDLLEKKIAQIESEQTERHAKMESFNAFQREQGSLDLFTSMAENETTLAYKSSLVALEQERSALEQKYGPNHPLIRANKKQEKALLHNIQNEVDAILTKMKAQTKIAERTLQDLRNKVHEYRELYREDAVHRLALRNLESEAETARVLFNNFMASYLESLQSVGFQKSDITIVSEATPATSPSFPKVFLVIALCGMAGIFVGIFVALVLAKLQKGFVSVRQLEKLTGLPVYGVLPVARHFKGKYPADFISKNTATGLAELVRSLYTALKLRDPKKKSGGRVVTMTSTMPHEGKTTISVWLATVAAKNGDRVLLIDADMRRPSLHKKYDIGNVKGLVDYLTDRMSLDDVIYTRHASGVHVMSSKAVPTQALTLLTNDRMEAMIRRVRDHYDLVIIDAPTAMIFSDARVLAQLSDKTFYVVEEKTTDRDVCMSSMKQFIDMGYHDLALVFNKAKVDHYMKHRKGDLAYLYQAQAQDI